MQSKSTPTAHPAPKAHGSHASAATADRSKHIHAFGIDVDAPKSPGETKKPASTNVLWIGSGVIVLLIAVIVFTHVGGSDDPDVKDHPDVAKVEKFHKSKDVAALAPMVKDHDATVARRAVIALADLGDAGSISGAMTDSRPEVRAIAASMMARVPGPQQVPVLAQAMRTDTDKAVRLSAMRSLSQVNDVAILDPLIEMLNDRDPSIRRSALAAIENRLGFKYPKFNPDIGADTGPNAAILAQIRNQAKTQRGGLEAQIARDKQNGGSR